MKGGAFSWVFDRSNITEMLQIKHKTRKREFQPTIFGNSARKNAHDMDLLVENEKESEYNRIVVVYPEITMGGMERWILAL